MVSATAKVYRLLEKKGSRDAVSRPKEKMKLKSHVVDFDDLRVGRMTRLALRDAFVSKHFGRVWGVNTLDPLLRGALIVLLLSFDI